MMEEPEMQLVMTDEQVQEAVEKVAHAVYAEFFEGKTEAEYAPVALLGIQTSGIPLSRRIAKYIREKTGYDTKATVLGHTQRGGNPSQSDRILASRLAEAAVRLLYKGVSNRVVGLRSNQVVDMDIEEALKCKKELDVNIYKLCQILAE